FAYAGISDGEPTRAAQRRFFVVRKLLRMSQDRWRKFCRIAGDISPGISPQRPGHLGSRARRECTQLTGLRGMKSDGVTIRVFLRHKPEQGCKRRRNDRGVIELFPAAKSSRASTVCLATGF